MQEMTRFLNAFADGSTMESVALKTSFDANAVSTNPCKRSKAKNHVTHLKTS